MGDKTDNLITTGYIDRYLNDPQPYLTNQNLAAQTAQAAMGVEQAKVTSEFFKDAVPGPSKLGPVGRYSGYDETLQRCPKVQGNKVAAMVAINGSWQSMTEKEIAQCKIAISQQNVIPSETAIGIVNNAYPDGVALNSMSHPTPEIEITDEMIRVGWATWLGTGGKESILAQVYRAMHALAPVDLISDNERLLLKRAEQAEDHVRRLQEQVASQAKMIQPGLVEHYRRLAEHWEFAAKHPDDPESMLMTGCWFVQSDVDKDRTSRRGWDEALSDMKHLCIEPVKADTGSTPDYHGPTKPGSDGRHVPIPDTIHERVHEVVKDVLAGRVIPKARDQLQDALSQPVAPEKASASTGKPLPGKALGLYGDPRRLGLA